MIKSLLAKIHNFFGGNEVDEDQMNEYYDYTFNPDTDKLIIIGHETIRVRDGVCIDFILTKDFEKGLIDRYEVELLYGKYLIFGGSLSGFLHKAGWMQAKVEDVPSMLSVTYTKSGDVWDGVRV